MSGGGATSEFSIVIPELETLAQHVENRSFCEEEDQIIVSYWGRVPRQKLVDMLNKKFNKCHSLEQVKHRYKRLQELAGFSAS